MLAGCPLVFLASFVVVNDSCRTCFIDAPPKRRLLQIQRQVVTAVQHLTGK